MRSFTVSSFFKFSNCFGISTWGSRKFDKIFRQTITIPQPIFQQQLFLKFCSKISQSLNSIKHRISCPEVFCKKNVLENFAKFTGKQLCNNFVKFLRIPFFIEHLQWLLLKAIATLFSIGTASRNRVSCFSSLFLAKVTIPINVSSVIREYVLNCCLMARKFLLFHIC